MPKILQQKVVDTSHEGYHGIHCKEEAAVTFFYLVPRNGPHIGSHRPRLSALPGINSADDSEPLLMTDSPERPWQKIAIYFSGSYASGVPAL